MAARTRKPFHDDATRAKIQTTQLVKRLTDHVLGTLKKPMDGTQVTAALGLLKKVLPDLSSTNVQGDIFNHHYVVDSNPMSEDDWEKQYSRDLEASGRPPKGTG